MVWDLSIRDGSGLSNVKILITLAYGEGCVRPRSFRDLCEEIFDLHEPDKPHFSLRINVVLALKRLP